ncbi:MAG: LysR family transcriptional regulator [Cellvibrionaceae bacterium]
MDTIEGMRVFAAVATKNSFTAGAKQLGVSTKLASKYVRQLEAHLGAQLFNRTTRSVTLTETGHVYFQQCVGLLDQFDELESLVQERQSELAGPIRMTAPTGFGGANLVKCLKDFQLDNPKVSIDLHLSDYRVDIIEGGFDLAIRFGELKDSSLMARKLLSMRIVAFASPEYLEKNGEPVHPNALSTHNCLLQASSTDPEHWRFRINNELISQRVSGSFRANSPRAVAQMAVGGLGIGMCPLYAVEPLVKKGKLRLLFENYEATKLGLFVVYPLNRHLTARIRSLIDHLVDAFQN